MVPPKHHSSPNARVLWGLSDSLHEIGQPRHISRRLLPGPDPLKRIARLKGLTKNRSNSCQTPPTGKPSCVGFDVRSEVLLDYVGNVKLGKLVVDSSNCVDDSGLKPLQECDSLSKLIPALKMFDNLPDRDSYTLQPNSSGLHGATADFKPFKASSAPSFAEIVKGTSGQCAPFRSDGRNSFYNDSGFHAVGQIAEMDGQRVVSFSSIELEELAAPFEFTLIGKFSHGFPSMKPLKLKMAALNFRGEFSVACLDRKHVLIRFLCEEDYTRLWCGQIWYMDGYPMRILKWTTDFIYYEEPSYAPVWVKLPFLPIHLFDKKAIFNIASLIGKPLQIDDATIDLTRAWTPRVCIEIDLSKPLMQEVLIVLNGEKLTQKIVYEKVPKYCSHCKHIGHCFNQCLALKHVKDLEGTADSEPQQSVGTATRLGEKVLQGAVTQPVVPDPAASVSSMPVRYPKQCAVIASRLFEQVPDLPGLSGAASQPAVPDSNSARACALAAVFPEVASRSPFEPIATIWPPTKPPSTSDVAVPKAQQGRIEAPETPQPLEDMEKSTRKKEAHKNGKQKPEHCDEDEENSEHFATKITGRSNEKSFEEELEFHEIVRKKGKKKHTKKK